MKQQKSNINPIILQEMLDSAVNAADKGQSQFFTPPEFAAWCAAALPPVRPVIVDLNAGAGNLLHAASTPKTEHRLGLDIEPCRSAPNTAHITRITRDATLFYGLAKEVDFKADLFVLNPPWRLLWHRSRLADLAGSDVLAVRDAYAQHEENTPKGTIDSTIATLMMALDLGTIAGEGFLIANNNTLERLLFRAGAPYASLARHVWAHVVIPGNPMTAINDCKWVKDDGEGENQFLTGVIYFATEHTQGHTRYEVPDWTAQANPADRALRYGAEIFSVHDCRASTAGLWETIKEQIADQAREHPRVPYNVFLGIGGAIRTMLSRFEEVSVKVDKRAAAKLQKLNGKTPMQLVIQRQQRDDLMEILDKGGWRVEPALRDAVRQAFLDYHAQRAPLYPLPEIQRLGYLDEQDAIECKKDLVMKFRPAPGKVDHNKHPIHDYLLPGWCIYDAAGARVPFGPDKQTVFEELAEADKALAELAAAVPEQSKLVFTTGKKYSIRSQTVKVTRTRTKPNSFTGEKEEVELTGQQLAFYIAERLRGGSDDKETIAEYCFMDGTLRAKDVKLTDLDDKTTTRRSAEPETKTVDFTLQQLVEHFVIPAVPDVATTNPEQYRQNLVVLDAIADVFKQWKLKGFQRQDLARAALHDGLILGWETGLGKTWALFIWPLLKVGYDVLPDNVIRPKAPVLIIAPGDLHQQIMNEGSSRFNITVTPITSQDDYQRLCAAHAGTLVAGAGRLAPGVYITSYTQLTTNGVLRLPDAMDAPDPVALLQSLSLNHGDPVEAEVSGDWEERPDFETTNHFFAWRAVKWADDYYRLGLDPNDTVKELESRYDALIQQAYRIVHDETREQTIASLNESHATLKLLVCQRPSPSFKDLAGPQQDFVLRHFLDDKLARYAAGIGTSHEYRVGPLPEGFDPEGDEEDPRPLRTIECVYSASLSDMSHDAFDCVVIDEGVKMKGEDTYVGRGVRKMNPRYRLVLTATPVKNRLPDIFWLAWWATGAHPKAHARFCYDGTSEDRNKFSETFMVTEQNLSKEAKARSEGKPVNGRYKKLTAEVCNIHLLWKLLAPILLRRRKDDCGEDIVPKIRQVIRCEMGTQQQQVYQYHLQATYIDCNEQPAVGAQLQALRAAAADPTAEGLEPRPGNTTKPCRCTIISNLRNPNSVPGSSPTVAPTQLAGAMIEINGTLIPETTDAPEDSKNSESASPVPPVALTQSAQSADPNCPHCQGEGHIQLPSRSTNPFIPKMASCLTLIEKILARQEQVVVFSAFHDPLDRLGEWLDQAAVRHVKLDGRVSQKRRGQLAAEFKRGRYATPETQNPKSVPASVPPVALTQSAIPVMLAGVESMAEGHSFELANNVILIAYSWAYDKFIQAINRVHRMTSAKPVNLYVIVCQGTIDLRLENLIQDKGDAAELVLDGRLLGEVTEEVNLSELLKIAWQEFDGGVKTIDEAHLHAQWIGSQGQVGLRDQLRATAARWTEGAPIIEIPSTSKTKTKSSRPPAAVRNHTNTMRLNQPLPTPEPIPAHEHQTMARRNEILRVEPIKPVANDLAPAALPPARMPALDPAPAAVKPGWKERLKAIQAKAALIAKTQTSNGVNGG